MSKCCHSLAITTRIIIRSAIFVALLLQVHSPAINTRVLDNVLRDDNAPAEHSRVLEHVLRDDIVTTASNATNMTIISLSTAFGKGRNSGLNNQRAMFVYVVAEALKRNALLDASSLRHRSAWNVHESISHQELYDVDHWNKYAEEHPGSLPFMVTMDDLKIVGDKNDTAALEHKPVQMDFRFFESAKLQHRRLKEIARHVYQALIPSPEIQQIIDSVKPKGPYGAIHFRVESDLKQAPPLFWQSRVSVRQVLESLRLSRIVSQCMYNSSATSIYAAVAIRDVDDPDDLALLHNKTGPWPGTHLAFHQQTHVASHYREASSIVGALVDLEVARQATAFVAGHWSMSSFSRAIADYRWRFYGGGGESFVNQQCQHLFFDYSSNRTYEALDRKYKHLIPTKTKWRPVPQNASKWNPNNTRFGLGSMLLHRIPVNGHRGSTQLLTLSRVLELQTESR